MKSIDNEKRVQRRDELQIRWKQQDLEGEKAIIHFLRKQLLEHEQKANTLIDEINVMRERT
jgi:hypothetical protein